jgi:transposase
MKKIPKDAENNIVNQLCSGVSIRKVALQFGISSGAVGNIRKNYQHLIGTNKGGRPNCLSGDQKRSAVRYVTQGGLENAVQVRNVLLEDGVDSVSASTVRRAFLEAGLGSFEKEKRPAISAKNAKKRLQFAKKYRDWTVHDWRHVVFSDETKINRFNSDGRVWGWKRHGQSRQKKDVKETAKHGGGSIMVWSSISDAGVGWLVRIEGNMDKELYLQILQDDLEKNMNLAAESMGQDRSKMIFQQDNDPKHTSKVVQNYLKTVDFKTLDHPPQSPDLNPIEHMWALVKRRLNEYDTPPSGINELYDRVCEIWYKKITLNEVYNVIDSMPRRLEAVIKAKGYWTKY